MEDLSKASKNVKAQRAAGSAGHQRMMEYIRSKGFQPREGKQERFGAGPSQNELIYSTNTGMPEHEMAHALMTPVGESLKEHQKRMGSVTAQAGEMSRSRANFEEYAAYAMQPGLQRRAGVTVIPQGGAEGSRHMTEAPSREKLAGRHELNCFDRGTKAIGPKGQVQAGTSVDAKINARSMNKEETPTSNTPDPDAYDKPPQELAGHVLFGGGGKRVGIMTAERPRHPSAPGGNEELKRDLTGMGLKYEETEGQYDTPENSLIVHHPTREQMDHLGKKFGQESVVYGEGGRHELRYTNDAADGGPKAGQFYPSVPQMRYSMVKPANNYTRVPGKGYLSLGFDWNRLMGNPVVGKSEIRDQLLGMLCLVLRKNT
jgi:hypothetical protein